MPATARPACAVRVDAVEAGSVGPAAPIRRRIGALLLADREIVLSDRPPAIVAEVRVGQPHPRRRDDPDLVALRRSLLEKLGISHDV